MQIGTFQLPNQFLLAPMAGITDKPFRQLCSQFGAGLTISEMVISNENLQSHPKTLKKADFSGVGLHSVQILGADPKQMAMAAEINQARGAQIIDINMGCPAKKVCSVSAGSALLRDEVLVESILMSVVSAVEVPVTLKIRTGWDLNNINAIRIAKIAENAGIQAITIHGRTRACKFHGEAEYETIKQVKQVVNIPVIANGDINCSEKARKVLQFTQADGIMIGRAARGNPWIFKELNAKLNNRPYIGPTLSEIKTVINQHLDNLYSFYGNNTGVRIARKHIGWYFDCLGSLPVSHKSAINHVLCPKQQIELVNRSFNFIIPRAA
jgi:tRNA-dihydrouridine synthase B